MTELLFAEKKEAFTDFNGILVSSPSRLSLTKAFANGNATSLTSFLDKNKDKRIISDTDVPDTCGFEKKVYTLFTLDRLTPPKIFSGEMKKGASGELLSLMLKESAGVILPRKIEEEFEKEKGEGTYLWHDNRVCAMARAAFRGKKYARINTVVTAENKRGRGYASMLVYTLSSLLLSEGLTVTVLADTENPVSGRMYASLGFLPHGKIYEYIPKNDLLSETALTSSCLG